MTEQTAQIRPTKRILVIDDHPMIREGLAALLSAEPDLELCDAASDIDAAVKRIGVSAPDIAIVDVSLKGSNGIDSIGRLKAISPELIVLVWSMHDEELYAGRALHAGARGYITKSGWAREIIEAIHAVMEGRTYVSGMDEQRLT